MLLTPILRFNISRTIQNILVSTLPIFELFGFDLKGLFGREKSSEEFEQDPFEAPQIPNWARVTSAIPNFFDMLKEAVLKDNRI